MMDELDAQSEAEAGNKDLNFLCKTKNAAFETDNQQYKFQDGNGNFRNVNKPHTGD